MIVLDKMLIGGLKFVFEKIANAVDAELNDADRLREELLAAQMRLETGEIDEHEFAGIERDVIARLRAIEKRKRGGEEAPAPGEYKVTGIEATVGGDEGELAPAARRVRPRRARRRRKA